MITRFNYRSSSSLLAVRIVLFTRQFSTSYQRQKDFSSLILVRILCWMREWKSSRMNMLRFQSNKGFLILTKLKPRFLKHFFLFWSFCWRIVGEKYSISFKKSPPESLPCLLNCYHCRYQIIKLRHHAPHFPSKPPLIIFILSAALFIFHFESNGIFSKETMAFLILSWFKK